jgi:hypothetical protein
MLLIILGLAFLFNWIQLSSIVSKIEVSWYKWSPDGTRENPTVLAPRSPVTVSCLILYFDKLENKTLIPYGDINHYRVSFSIYYYIQESGNWTLLETFYLNYEGQIEVEGRYIALKYLSNWYAPSSEGLYITYWHFYVLEENPNGGYDTPYHAYGPEACIKIVSASGGIPDGVFYVNNKDASKDIALLVFDPTISIRFTATAYGEKIQNVYVEVYRDNSKIDTIQLSGTNPSWTATYKLPSPGTYNLKGYFKWVGSDTPVKKMDVIAPYGKQTVSKPLFTQQQLVGILFILAGTFIISRRRFA